jgi:ribosome-associated protein
VAKTKKKTKIVKKKKPVRKAAKAMKKAVKAIAKKKLPVKAKSKLVRKIAKSAKKAAKKTVKKLAKKPAQKIVKKIAKKVAKSVPQKSAPKKTAKVAEKKSAPKPIIKKIPGLPGELYEAAMKVLEDRQAEDIVPLDLEGRSSMADYIIVATGRGARQIAAIADYLREAFMKLGVGQVRIEGMTEGNWVLVDAGDIVVHLFRPEVREYYHLEDIWNRKRG